MAVYFFNPIENLRIEQRFLHKVRADLALVYSESERFQVLENEVEHFVGHAPRVFGMPTFRIWTENAVRIASGMGLNLDVLDQGKTLGPLPKIIKGAIGLGLRVPVPSFCELGCREFRAL